MQHTNRFQFTLYHSELEYTHLKDAVGCKSHSEPRSSADQPTTTRACLITRNQHQCNNECSCSRLCPSLPYATLLPHSARSSHTHVPPATRIYSLFRSESQCSMDENALMPPLKPLIALMLHKNSAVHGNTEKRWALLCHPSILTCLLCHCMLSSCCCCSMNGCHPVNKHVGHRCGFIQLADVESKGNARGKETCTQTI